MHRGARYGKLSFQAKKAYFAKHRKSNFSASLRLEGFSTSLNDEECKLPSRKAALKAVQQLKV
ncbi:YhfG family protein [Pseudomonas chlororaphis]|uniref:YhfG family protein n=1 Tax=Pseudomonas chlororaphis TaxID=587753 RepID=UPI001C6098AA|nr:YhfG family protein [Pseudomonas chlororaphis]